ncbi:AP-3 complex subunit beta [Coemansia spiralis]|uniref:AP-3 complex subunit beta n=2 Tax=Coemansia TaxID=4863 RepID=A0A9W8L117_9FUNG|nr:AP-3 complex subunit beta [Coemansia umbellata]KAJ2625972.1 AP-3 complex subunit beta [Coemansia sp. RSA 1358]KAJ2680698.1 AP-3 complex subunit beta [Coemansia spiralis]
MSEYLSRAMALAQDAAKLSLRFSEEIVDNALEFGLDTPGSFYNNAEFNLMNVRKALNSGSDKEKIVAMKRLLATIAKGLDASEYFADVVKNVASGSLEVRRLVYIYLLRYAEQEQDLALLSVNTFQRDLTDSNQVIRAMALRVMTSIRVPVISSIAMMAVRKLAKDRSPHVRKTAALAISKLLRLNSSLKEELIEVVSEMLSENSPLAVGSVIQAFRTVCPTNYDMVHMNFRRWCLMLGELDEWGQIELVKLLTAYARGHFLCPDTTTTDSNRNNKRGESNGLLDPDHELLLKIIHPLLQSRNSAVVMCAVSAYYHLAPASRLESVARPLVRLMRTNREAGYAALTNILQIALRRPEIFSTHMRSFFVAASDPPFIRKLKLQVLAAIVAPDTVQILVPEVANYTQSTQEDVAVGAVGVLLSCAQRMRESTMDCFHSLVLLLDDARPHVVNEAMRVIRILLLDGSVRDSQDRRSVTLYDIMCYLVRRLDRCTTDAARAYILSLVSEFATSKFGCLHALDVLRSAVRSFKDEKDMTKMQIIELCARLVLLRKSNISNSDTDNKDSSITSGRNGNLFEVLQRHSEILYDLQEYLFTLARYDVSFDVRDRARLLRALCPLGGDEAHSEEMPQVLKLSEELIGYGSKQILDNQTSVELRKSIAAQPKYMVGSLSLAMDHRIDGYSPLPDWPATKPEEIDRGSFSVSASHAPQSAVDVPGPGGSRAISIAGISGRAQPHSSAAEYSTPRSVGGAYDDDLDAFLNSEEDNSTSARMLPKFIHGAQSLQKTAVLFQQSELESDSSFSESDSDLEDSGSESGTHSNGSEPETKSTDQDTETGSDKTDDESEEEAEGESEEERSGDENENNPFISTKSVSLSGVGFVENQLSGTRSNSQPAIQQQRSGSGHIGYGAGHNSDDEVHVQPLIEGTSKYWQ